MKNKNQVFAIRSDKDVTALVNGVSYYKSETDKIKAQTLYEKIKTVALNPTTKSVGELVEEFDPTQKLYDGKSLVKDSIGNWYLKGYSEPLPSKLLTKMRTFIDNNIPLTPLVNFWKLLMLNPAEHVKRDLYNFMDQYEFPLTDSGYFIAYKAVKQTDKTYKAVNMWVPKEYIQLKASGKNPKDYTVVDKNSDFSIVETSLITDNDGNFIAPEHVAGNLEEMFSSMNDLGGDVDAPEFTDHWGGSTQIRLGSPVSMPRTKCDSDPNNTCSSGLHVGAPGYVKGYGGGGGNVYLATLVNPMNVVACPADYSYQKMRCCEYYAYGIVDLDNDMSITTPYFEHDYKTWETESLEEKLKKYQHARGEAAEHAIIMRERLVTVA
jgi:hypothetical protein